MSKSRRALLLMCVLVMAMFWAAPMASAEDPVLGKSPAKDAPLVAEMPGFQRVMVKNFAKNSSMNDGVVIRQSYIEDGKIVIPPAGLYYSLRVSPQSRALYGDRLVIAGKTYYFVEYGTSFDVVRDVTMKVGDCAPMGDGSKCWELSSIGYGFAGDIPGATFQILKPSGNYYGTSFPVRVSPLLIPATALAWGSHNPTGTLLPGAPTDWQIEYYGYNVATSGQSYVVVDKITPTEVHLQEAGTGGLTWMTITETAPVTGTVSAGKTMDLGKYKVKLVAADAKAATAEIEVLEGNKVVASKKLGPVTKGMFDYLPEDPTAREKLTLSTDEFTVHLQVYGGQPFAGDQVALVGYTDLIKVENPDDWPDDPRFVVRPDT
jgi:hypothetical protein